MLRREPEVLAVTRKESEVDPNGVKALCSALVILARFFCGPSSPSVVASSAAEVLPLSTGFLRGRPLGLPVGALFLLDALEEGLEPGAGCLSTPFSTAIVGVGDGAFSAGAPALGAAAMIGGPFVDVGRAALCAGANVGGILAGLRGWY